MGQVSGAVAIPLESSMSWTVSLDPRWSGETQLDCALLADNISIWSVVGTSWMSVGSCVRYCWTKTAYCEEVREGGCPGEGEEEQSDSPSSGPIAGMVLVSHVRYSIPSSIGSIDESKYVWDTTTYAVAPIIHLGTGYLPSCLARAGTYSM